MSLLLNFLAATGEAQLRNLLIILRIFFSQLVFLRGIFPSKGQTVISSTRFFRGFSPVITIAAVAILAQVLAGGLRSITGANFFQMVFWILYTILVSFFRYWSFRVSLGRPLSYFKADLRIQALLLPIFLRNCYTIQSYSLIILNAVQVIMHLAGSKRPIVILLSYKGTVLGVGA